MPFASFADRREAYRAVSEIRDLSDAAVWDVEVLPYGEEAADVSIPRELIARCPDVSTIVHSHGGRWGQGRAGLPPPRRPGS